MESGGRKLLTVFIPEGYCWVIFIQATIFPPTPLFSPLSFLYTVLSQQAAGTASHPCSVCIAKYFYTLASGYGFSPSSFFSLPTFSHLSLVSVLWAFHTQYNVTDYFRNPESCMVGVKMAVHQSLGVSLSKLPIMF